MKKKILKTLIYLLLFLGLAGFFLVNTKQGLNFCFTVTSKFVSGKLSIEKLDGKILGPLNAKKVYFENDDILLFLGELDLNWKIKKTQSGRRPIFIIHANNIEIKVKKSDDDQGGLDIKQTISDIEKYFLPILLSLEDVELNNMLLSLDGLRPTKFSKVTLRANATNGDDISSLKFELDSDPAKILVNGSLIDGYDLNWKMDLTDFGLFFRGMEGSLNAEGKVIGAFDGPEVESKIFAKKFKYDDFSFDGLESKIYVDWSLKKKSYFDLDIKLPKIDHIHFNKLGFSGTISPLKFKESFKFDINMDSSTMFFPVSEKQQSLILKKGVLDGSLNKDGLSIKSVLSLKDSNPINVDLKLPELINLESIFHEQSINGKAIWETKNLSFLQFVIPNVKNVKGVLEAEYSVSGTLNNPKAIGNFKLYNGGLRIPGLNVNLKNIKLNAKNIGNEIEYNGIIYGDRGSISIDGSALFSQGKFSSDANVSGKDFLLINNKQYKIVISPKLVLSFDDDFFNFVGDLNIPEGVISPAEFSRDERLPREVVYVNKDKKEKKEDFNMNVVVDVALGNNVLVDVMGLKGKLTGEIKIKDEAKKTTTAVGNLYIKDGRYDIYGQNLDITKGSLHFLGGEVTNPEVNLEAVRDFKATNVPQSLRYDDQALKVGVRVMGMLNNPKISLFSIPSGLSSSDILSYLIIGKPSDQLTESKAQLLLQAATALNFGGSSQVGGVISGLRDKLGFSDFGFVEETSFSGSRGKSTLQRKSERAGGSLATNTSFMLGRFLTPKIYASYSMGLVDESNIFRIKYYINKYFSVQSETSSTGSNAVDFFYTIER